MPLDCPECGTAAPAYDIPIVFNKTYQGGGPVQLMPDPLTGLTTLNGDFAIGGECAKLVPNSVVITTRVTGPAAYSADNVSTTTVLETTSSATVVGAISTSGNRVTFNITVPTAVLDEEPVYFRYTKTENGVTTTTAIQIATNYTSDGCAPVVDEVECLQQGLHRFVCPLARCEGQTYRLYTKVAGEDVYVGSYDEYGVLTVDNTDYLGIVTGAYVDSNTPGFQAEVTLGISPGVACGTTWFVLNEDGARTYFGACGEACQYAYAFDTAKGGAVTYPLTVTSLYHNGNEVMTGPSASLANSGAVDAFLEGLSLGSTFAVTAGNTFTTTTQTSDVWGTLTFADTSGTYVVTPTTLNCI